VNDKIKYWTDISDYDLETAEAMLSTERFLYVGFMCHQAIEKIFKAHYCLSSDEPPPYSHIFPILPANQASTKNYLMISEIL
jgi:HEPN domain-containing protein